MKICARCLYPDTHPLNLTLDEHGICSGCRIHEEKDILSWEERKLKLKIILNNYRSKTGNSYDCIIPVSGARDSFFIVHTIKKEFGMNPLLVTYNKHYNTDLGYRNLARLRTVFDSDIITQTVSHEKIKRITKTTLRLMGSLYWHCIAGQTVFPVQTAVKLKIPLIIWGVHQGIDQVGMFSHLNEVEMTRKYRKEHDLMGYEAEDLIDDFDGLKEEDIFNFSYPENEEIEAVGVRGIYLNNYIRWDSKAQHENMIKMYGYESNLQTRTFDTYNDVDCFNYSDVHDYIKFLKHGYGKVTDHVAREIRLRRLTREQGQKLIEQYQNIRPVHLEKFLEWMKMDQSGFEFLLDQHRSPKIWKRDNNWEWHRIQPETYHEEAQRINFAKLEQREVECSFMKTENKRKEYVDNKYILMGKGQYDHQIIL